ncbi:MAG TPA: protein kinase [Polyangia bacterium]|nr:protein kinase [Polyangia bacterium]
MIGRTLGSYTIVEQIGAGGMGEVYLAKHRRIERKAAIKLLLPALSRDADIVSRFFNEARATSLITHPGIVQIYDCEVFEDRAYIVMEYLEGSNLNAAIIRDGAFEIPMAIWISGQIASALSAAHAKGIIHRDLKPENIYLAQDPLRGGATVVKILDFGIAKLSDRSGPTSHTRTGSILGTPIYMSPEQCRGISSIDHRTDIYALGGILFEMLTGRPPFVKEAPGDLLIAHVSEAPPVPSSLRPAIPPELDRLVLRMLAKSPNDRPPTMEAVGRELTPFHAAAGDPAGPVLTMRFDSPTPAPVASASPSAGGTRLLPDGPKPLLDPKSTSTLGDTASEIVTASDRPRAPRRTGMWLVIGGLAAAGVAVAVLRPDRAANKSTGGDQVTVAHEPAAPAPRPSIEVPPSAPELPAAAPAAEPAKVTLVIASQPAGASLWVGDASQPRGKTPLRLAVPRGKDPLRATLKADGYVDRTIVVDADRDQSLDVKLDPIEQPHHASHASGGGHHHASHGPSAQVATPPPPVEAPKATTPPRAEQPQKKYFLLGD